MSKTKRRRVRRQQMIRGFIAIAVIAAVILTVWQIGLGSNVVKVNGTSVRSGLVNGVEAFLSYYQTGQWPGDSLKGKTGEELDMALDMALVARNSMIQSIFVQSELIRQDFKAQGNPFPNETEAEEIQGSVDSLFSNVELARLLRSNGVNRSHVEYYFTYLSALTRFMDDVMEADPITDDDELQYYSMYLPYFQTPLSVEASHILIMDPDHTPAKRAEIEAILERLNEGEDFEELAIMYSDDGSAEQGGYLGSFGAGQMVAPFEEAAFALQPGEISGIVETEFGFHIILLLDRTEEGYATIDEVRSQLAEMIAADRLTAAVTVLMDAANIQYFGMITPSTGKPPISLSELEEARNPGGAEEVTE